MKYIIDIPNADISRWIGETPLGKKLYVPISVEDGKEYSIGTGIYVEEYTEPDRKAIDLQHAHDIENVAKMNYNEGAKDAWKFAKKIGSFNGLAKRDLDECFGHTTIQGVMTKYDTYREAKEKYEEWRKQKDNVVKQKVFDLAEEIGIHRLYAIVREMRGE